MGQIAARETPALGPDTLISTKAGAFSGTNPGIKQGGRTISK